MTVPGAHEGLSSLAGLRVVELGVWVAAPSAAALLADWGADVVKVEPPSGDPMRKLLGPEWHKIHWYATPQERELDLAEMRRRHEYSRATDAPSLRFEKIENLAESRGL